MDDSIYALITKACILVTLTLLLTRTGLFRHLLHPRLPLKDQAVALVLFLIMAISEETIAHPSQLMNARIVAVCAAGLLAGPWVGGIVGVVVTALAVRYHPDNTPSAIAISMIFAGLIGGWVRMWRPALAIRPSTGFLVGASISLLRFGLMVAWHQHGSANRLGAELTAAVMHGASVALILIVIGQFREMEAQARSAAMAEVSALRSRMDPHFLFNSLNTISSLSLIDPHAVPEAADRLALFMRASLDQHERALVALSEELAVVGAYLDVEKLRMGERLKLEQDIDPGLLNAFVPPFLLQPLVENAVRHGIQPSANGGVIRLKATADDKWLLLTVADSGVGVSVEAGAGLFATDTGHAHALSLLRRRLQGLYGSAFLFTVGPNSGAGTTATVRIPYGQAVHEWILQ